MKKLSKFMTAALLVLAMLALAGCSAAGNGFINTAKEINDLDKYTYSGQMDLGVAFDGLVDESQLTEEDKAAFEMLENMKITYNGAYKADDQTYYMDMKMTMGKYQIPMEIYMNSQQMLISANSLIDTVKAVGADQKEIDATISAIGSVKWIEMDEATEILNEMLGGADAVALSNSLYAVIGYFADNSFRNYDPGCFSGNSSQGYKMTINDANMQSVVKGFINYAKNNAAAIKNDIDKQADVINSSLSLFILDADTIKEIIDSMAHIDVVTADETVADICASLKGTDFSTTLKKTGSGHYSQLDTGKIVINGLDDAGGSLTIKINSTMNIDAAAVVQITMPATDVKSMSGIAAGLKPVAIEATFYMDDNEFWLDKSFNASMFNTSDCYEVKAILKNNYNYFPMRQISELFGENVVWDKATGEIYVSRDGKKIDMSGFIVNNRTYVKLRDFEKLGYKIDYCKDPDLGGIAYIEYAVK